MTDELKPSPEAVRIAAWLREDAAVTEREARRIVANTTGNARDNAAEWQMLVGMKRGLADAIERGDYRSHAPAALVIDRPLRPATMPGDVVEDQCANCHGIIGELASGRDPEELCDTCYEDSQAARSGEAGRDDIRDLDPRSGEAHGRHHSQSWEALCAVVEGGLSERYPDEALWTVELPASHWRALATAHTGEAGWQDTMPGDVVEAREVLSGISSYLGAGLGDDSTTLAEFNKRIRWGIDHIGSVYRNRAAQVVEECSKRPSTTWGAVRSAILDDTVLPTAARTGEAGPAGVVEALAKGGFIMSEPHNPGGNHPRARKLVIGFENADDADDAMAAVSIAIRALRTEGTTHD